MVATFQRQPSSARLFYLRFASLPTPRPSAGTGTRNSSSCGPFKVQFGEYGVNQMELVFS